MTGGKSIVQNILLVTFIYYLAFLIWTVLFKYTMPTGLFRYRSYYSRNLNFIPFNDLRNGHFNRLDIYGNILLFIPFGIYLGLFTKRKIKYLIPVVTSFLFETLQYVFALGGSDITDIILNTTGAFLGIGICHGLFVIFKKERTVKGIVAAMSTAVMVLVSIIVLFLQMYN